MQYLLAVVEWGGFTRAAERLHLAQPGVNAQIRQPERELGRPLLDRSGRTVTTTAVGEAVLPHARAALAAVEGMRQTVDEFTGLVRGQVTIGLVSGAAAEEFDVAAVLAGFHEEHPGVETVLREDTSARMRTALRRGELDLALAGVTEADPPPGADLRIVVDVPLVAAVPVGDPLLVPADRSTLPLAAFTGRPLISLPRGTGSRGTLDNACRRAALRPHNAFEAAAPALLARLAAAGLGVAVLPDVPAEAAAAPGLRTLRLVPPDLRTGRPRLAVGRSHHPGGERPARAYAGGVPAGRGLSQVGGPPAAAAGTGHPARCGPLPDRPRTARCLPAYGARRRRHGTTGPARDRGGGGRRGRGRRAGTAAPASPAVPVPAPPSSAGAAAAVRDGRAGGGPPRMARYPVVRGARQKPGFMAGARVPGEMEH
ncbi:LysR substrate-binding domain-containing protein [Streptomyces sp. CRN 30]|uniref:LysR family transcriptional regulator n=1 Tax=Streptomyces sp. CRN 30 TaxID=3075613 RepID=UPI002A800621|nr:LysR substrate-binding domain-containing protein [Streptomyces sp. CRN 30]